MVTGIESFKEWFKGNESQYAIIGGTACDILMTEEGLTASHWTMSASVRQSLNSGHVWS